MAFYPEQGTLAKGVAIVQLCNVSAIWLKMKLFVSV
jgi:hypothetical protein